jgi:hypothetical protein
MSGKVAKKSRVLNECPDTGEILIAQQFREDRPASHKFENSVVYAIHHVISCYGGGETTAKAAAINA